MRRRIKFLILPPVILGAASVAISLYITRIYESSITILIQKTEVPNPLTTLASAMTETHYDPLASFNQIIYSERTISQLMDSLRFEPSKLTEIQRRTLLGRIKENIQTSLEGDQSFTVTFADKDPYRAMEGVKALVNIYIQSSTKTVIDRNALRVAFYQKKLKEYRVRLDSTVKAMMPKLKDRIQTLPTGNTYLSSLDQQILDLQKHQADLAQNLTALDMPVEELRTKEGRQTVFDLQRSDIPYALELHTALLNYEDVNQRYTQKAPEFLKAESQLLALMDRIKLAVQSEINKDKAQLADIKKHRSEVFDEMVRSKIAQEGDQSMEANYAFYQRLYNEMNMKLEEAQISLALSKRAEDQFTIIDPAFLPLFPSKPSRMKIILGGIAVGVFIGLIAAILAELFDTTIQDSKDLLIYQKPVIAFLPEARKHKS